MYIAMIDEFNKDPSKYKFSKDLQKGVIAGSICPESLMRNVNDVFGLKQLSVCYGMTETSPVTF